jgi:hypothetical protein
MDLRNLLKLGQVLHESSDLVTLRTSGDVQPRSPAQRIHVHVVVLLFRTLCRILGPVCGTEKKEREQACQSKRGSRRKREGKVKKRHAYLVSAVLLLLRVK